MKTEFVRYLERLSEIYPTIDKASTEIINLQSILNLPKGTEHFLSDLHGEYAAFSHVLRNGSGAVRKKIDDVFGHTLSQKDKRELASLIYYPRQKIDYLKTLEQDTENWYKITLYRLIEICKVVSSKYTRSKVRKALPPAYAYVIEELITEKPEVLNRGAYFDGIVNTILEVGSADKFIVAMSELIHLRPWSCPAHHHGCVGRLSQLGYSVGQSRCYVDGQRGGKYRMYCKYHQKQYTLRKYRCSGRRIRH